MKAKDFLKRAKDQISDNIETRIPKTVKDLMEDTSTVFDTHCHLFGKGSVADWFTKIKLIEDLDPDGGLVKMMEKLYEKESDNFLDETLGIINSDDPADVLGNYVKLPATKNYIYSVLSMDLNGFLDKEITNIPYPMQLDLLQKLSKKEPILPFFAVDPRRCNRKDKENLYELFLTSFGRKPACFGVKVYPALGYLPSDPKLMPIFEICAEKNIPITAHCGSTSIHSFRPVYELSGTPWYRWRFRKWDNRKYKFPLRLRESIGDSKVFRRAEFMNNPKHWEPILKEYPKLKLNLGHLGGTHHWENYKNKGKDFRLDTIHNLMQNYNVYGDFSGMLSRPELTESFLSSFDRYPLFKEKAMFGTDFWVVLPFGDYEKGLNHYIKTASPELRKVFEWETPRKYLFD